MIIIVQEWLEFQWIHSYQNSYINPPSKGSFTRNDCDCENKSNFANCQFFEWVRIVKNSPLFPHQCTFTFHRPRAIPPGELISLQAFNAL